MTTITNTKTSCPFGEKLQRYWDFRYDLFSRFDDGIQIDAEGLHSVLPESICLSIAEHTPGETIIDAFAGIGGNAIAFAKTNKKVIAIELDELRIKMAKHNAALYEVESSITFIQDDIFDRIAQIQADTIYLDPPWGWPSSKNMKTYSWNDFPIDVEKLLHLSRNYFSTVVFHVPKIFDLRLIENISENIEITENIFFGKVISKNIYFK